MKEDTFDKKYWYDVDRILLAWSLKKDFEKRHLISKDYRKELNELYGEKSSPFLTYFFSKKEINNKKLEDLLIEFIDYGFIQEIHIENKEYLVKYAKNVILDKINKNWLVKNNKYSKLSFLFQDISVTHLIVIVDYLKLNNYINTYLDKWFNGKIIKNETNNFYLKETKLLEETLIKLNTYYEKYGKQIKFEIDFKLTEYDFITPLLFLEFKKYISIEKHPSLKENNVMYIDIIDYLIKNDNELKGYEVVLFHKELLKIEEEIGDREYIGKNNNYEKKGDIIYNIFSKVNEKLDIILLSKGLFKNNDIDIQKKVSKLIEIGILKNNLLEGLLSFTRIKFFYDKKGGLHSGLERLGLFGGINLYIELKKYIDTENKVGIDIVEKKSLNLNESNNNLIFDGINIKYKGNLKKISGKQKHLIELLITKGGKITETDAEDIIYYGSKNIPNFKSLIAQVNIKLRYIKYNSKISQSNGYILLDISL